MVGASGLRHTQAPGGVLCSGIVDLAHDSGQVDGAGLMLEQAR